MLSGLLSHQDTRLNHSQCRVHHGSKHITAVFHGSLYFNNADSRDKHWIISGWVNGWCALLFVYVNEKMDMHTCIWQCCLKQCRILYSHTRCPGRHLWNCGMHEDNSLCGDTALLAEGRIQRQQLFKTDSFTMNWRLSYRVSHKNSKRRQWTSACM